MINPHVKWDRPERGAKVTLQEAIDYANRAKDQYKRAVGDQAVLNSALALGLIPLSAAALGLGITEGSGKAITALGLTGAAGFGVGTWLSSKPRQLVYIAGIKAMNCAVDAMLPLNFSEDEHRALRSDLFERDDPGNPSLNLAMRLVEGHVRNVRRLVGKVEEVAREETDLLERAKEDVRTAETLLESAKATLTSGTKLDREVARAGHVLMSAVDRIGAEVDKAIVATLPDIQALPAIINGLAQTSAQFTKIPVSPKSAEEMTGKSRRVAEKAEVAMAKEALMEQEKGAAIHELNDAMEVLKSSATKLSVVTQRVMAMVNSVSETRPLETLKECGVEGTPTGISVQPKGSVEFQAGKPGTRRLVVTGGKPPYAAELLEDPVAGLTVKQPVPFGPRIQIEATDKAPAGEYNVYIADAAGNSETVKVVVKAAK